MMRFIGIIPARYASTRFPGKPLVRLGDKAVIQHVYEKALTVLDEVYVATDDERIFSAVEAFGGKVVMTSPTHPSGTDRVFEAATKVLGASDVGICPEHSQEDTVIINIQGDEPFIHKTQIMSLCECFEDASTQIATLAKPITDAQVIFNPNSPKVVIDNNGFAMYFSRNPMPYNRNCDREQWMDNAKAVGLNYHKHIGLYAYRMNVLAEITRLPVSSLEHVEKLEQLRWLQNGYRIKVALTDTETIGIDTPEDLKRAEEFMKINIEK